MLLETVYFDKGQPAFTEEMKERLRYAARFVREFPNSPLVLEGHADNTGNEKRNVELSRQRAERIKGFLNQVHRIPMDQIHVTSYGSTEPIASNETAQGRRANRRVEITLVDEVPRPKAAGFEGMKGEKKK